MGTITYILKSEIQYLTVNRTYPDGEDHLLLDEAILEAAQIVENEKVLICNYESGARFETYVNKAGKGSQACFVCGPATRLVKAGDHISITSYTKGLAGLNDASGPVIIVPYEDQLSKQH